MKIKILIFNLICVFGLFFPLFVKAQSINYRAQGHYYSAKQALENKNYADAILYIEECLKALNGTNREVQYVYVLSAYYGGQFAKANLELERFFEIAEGILQPVQFDYSVDRLTNDEIKALTMLINPIEEALEEQLQLQERARQERERHEAAARNLSGTWVWTNPPSNNVAPTTLTLTQTSTRISGSSSKESGGHWDFTSTGFYGDMISENDATIKYNGTFYYHIQGLNTHSACVNYPNIEIEYDKRSGNLNIPFRECYMGRDQWGVTLKVGNWRTLILKKY